MPIVEAYTDAGTWVEDLVIDIDGCRDHLEDALCQVRGFVNVGYQLGNDHELVSADAADEVAGS